MHSVLSDAPLQFRFLFASQYGEVRVAERIPELADEPQFLFRFKLKQFLACRYRHAHVPLSPLLYHAGQALSTLPLPWARS